MNRICVGTDNDVMVLHRLNSEFGLSPTLVAAYGGCFLTKKCAEAAFAKHHRSMLAHDLVNEIPSTFYKLFDENDTS